MPKTTVELIKATLQEIEVLATGQSPSAEDSGIVEEQLIPVFEDLATRGIYSGATDDIDDACFRHLVVLLGNTVAPAFGKQSDERVRLLAEARLREISSDKYSGSVQQVDYF